METDFIYWRHHTPIGVKVEEISGGEGRGGAVWRAMALQVWKENGRDGYRDMDHMECGAPLLCGGHSRISLSHADGLLVVATLPPTPEAGLDGFAERTALGVDAERADRRQVLAVRERFMNADELSMTPADDVEANIVAWTSKEALYKAALTPGLDWRSQILLRKLPVPDGQTGEAEVEIAGRKIPFVLCSYRSDDFVVTLAITPRTATFMKQKKDKK